MFFDAIILSDKQNNSFLKSLERKYQDSCEFRYCSSYFELKRKIRERYPDILIIFLEKGILDKNEHGHLEKMILKEKYARVVFCCNDKAFLERQASDERRFFLEIEAFIKYHEVFLQSVFYRIESDFKSKFKLDRFFDRVIGISSVSRSIENAVRNSAKGNASVLLIGERGNEYDDIAYLIHQYSKRKKFNFISYDVAAGGGKFSRDIFGSVQGKELQGRGILEYVNNGTLFIKNIHLLSKEDRERLLLFLREGVFYRIVAKNKLSAQVRIIAYLPESEKKSFAYGGVNKELFDRLSIIDFRVPALKERKEDFLEISSALIEKIGREIGCENLRIDSNLLLKLSYLDWAWNVKELYLYLKFLSENILNGDECLKAFFNRSDAGNSEMFSKDLRNSRKEFEKKYIKKQLERFGGSITKTAKFIGINRVSLHDKMKKLNINRKKDQ